MGWKEFFTKVGIDRDRRRSFERMKYTKSFEKNRYGFCDKDRAIFPTFFLTSL